MDTPFTQMNAWRALMYWAAPWLLLCALWVGITRRRSAGFLLWVLALNAFAVGLLVIAQKLTGAEAIYWTYPSPNPQFAGPFTYRNHAGAFLYLSLAAPAILLYLTLRRREQGWLGKMVFLSFLLLFIYIAAVFTGSRGAFLFGTLYLVALLAIILFTQLFQGWRGLAVAFVLPLVLAAIAYAFWPQVSGVVQVLEDNLSRTERDMEGLEAGTDVRIRIPQLVWEMVEDKPWTGWGGGSFRYYFPVYQYQYPELTYSNYARVQERIMQGRRRIPPLQPRTYHYAHTDTLQMAAEYGLPIVGLLLLGGTLLLLWKVGGATGFVCLVLTGSGILLYYSHSWIEFLLFSPPGLLVAISLLAIRPKL